MKAAVLTVSDRCHRGLADDRSGPALKAALEQAGWDVVASRVVPDEVDQIRQTVLELVRLEDLHLLATTGGTGISPRDVTPEAVRPLLDKEIPGLAELMRLRGLEKTPYAALSRSLAGSIGETLVLCLPGSIFGATESLEAALSVLPHAVKLLQGVSEH